MTYFDLFYKTLAAQNIDNKTNKLVPLQFYAKNYLEFYSQLHSYAQTYKLNKFIVLTDGIPKKSTLENETDICDILSHNLNLNLEFISLPHAHASEFYLQKLIDILSQKQDHCGFIALGSGSITDLMKHALFLMDKNDAQFISVPTATTVTAFTSAFSVVDISGAKRTRISKNINATFWIEPLLKAAPISLTRAGFGDLLARFVAYGDWYLGSTLNMFDNYDEIALRLMEPFSDFLKSSELQNTELLTQTLAMAGVSMSLCNQTTPLSGYEHVISHGLDFLRLSSKRVLVLHGEQVSLSTLSSAMSYEWLLEQNEFNIKNFRTLNEKEAKTLIHKLLTNAPFMDEEKRDLTKVSEIFLQDYLEKNEKWNETKNNFNQFIEAWPQIKIRLKQLVLPSNEIEQILKKMELPLFPESTNPTTTALEYRWAMRFAPFVRSRFCLADFIFWIGEDPCAIASL